MGEERAHHRATNRWRPRWRHVVAACLVALAVGVPLAAGAAPPLTPTIEAAPARVSNDTSPTFAFSDSQPGVTFNCRLDKGAFPPCTSPLTYANVPDGAHTFYLKAVDSVGTESEVASYEWTVDTNPPPAPTISSGPPDPSGSSRAHFVFADSEAAVGFSCKLDDAAYAACSNPQDYTVADGRHTLLVKAVDAAGNASPASTPFSWTVDTVNPVVTIAEKPPALTNERTASFSFTSRAGSTFECARDGSVFVTCVSPVLYSGLVDGSHVFSVRARSPVGNSGPTTSYTWVIDTVAPQTTISAAPPAASTSASASFAFTSSEAASTFACSLDRAGLSPCTSPETYRGLGDGDHTFRVQGVDAAGNADPTPASYSWHIAGVGPETVDHTPPANVTRLKRRVGYRVLRLAWARPADADFDHFGVFVSTSAKSQPRLLVYRGTRGSYTNRRLNNALYYRYAVMSYDHAGNASRGRLISVPPSTLLRSPPNGGAVKRPPLLAWIKIPNATYYNAQLYRGSQKVLSAWPNRARLKLARSWLYAGRRFQLRSGLYRWYVWPGFGPRAAGRYGQPLGQGTFTVR